MANSQIDTSKKPRHGARYFIPRATKMVRMVEMVTTHTSAAKMNRGKRGRPSTLRSVSQDTVILRGRWSPGRPLPAGGTGPGEAAIKDGWGGGQGQSGAGVASSR